MESNSNKLDIENLLKELKSFIKISNYKKIYIILLNFFNKLNNIENREELLRYKPFFELISEDFELLIKKDNNKEIESELFLKSYLSKIFSDDKDSNSDVSLARPEIPKSTQDSEISNPISEINDLKKNQSSKLFWRRKLSEIFVKNLQIFFFAMDYFETYEESYYNSLILKIIETFPDDSIKFANKIFTLFVHNPEISIYFEILEKFIDENPQPTLELIVNWLLENSRQGELLNKENILATNYIIALLNKYVEIYPDIFISERFKISERIIGSFCNIQFYLNPKDEYHVVITKSYCDFLVFLNKIGDSALVFRILDLLNIAKIFSPKSSDIQGKLLNICKNAVENYSDLLVDTLIEQHKYKSYIKDLFKILEKSDEFIIIDNIIDILYTCEQSYYLADYNQKNEQFFNKEPLIKIKLRLKALNSIFQELYSKNIDNIYMFLKTVKIFDETMIETYNDEDRILYQSLESEILKDFENYDEILSKSKSKDELNNFIKKIHLKISNRLNEMIEKN